MPIFVVTEDCTYPEVYNSLLHLTLILVFISSPTKKSRRSIRLDPTMDVAMDIEVVTDPVPAAEVSHSSPSPSTSTVPLASPSTVHSSSPSEPEPMFTATQTETPMTFTETAITGN